MTRALIIYCVLAFVTTVAGSLLPLIDVQWTKKHLWRLLAFGSGVLLGIASLHLLPEAFDLAGRWAGITLLVAFASLFALENVTMVHACEDFLTPPKGPVAPAGALVALTLHAGIDGMAMGVGLRQSIMLGGVISLGVALHKFADGLTLTSLLQAANYSKRRQWTMAFVLAIATPLGVLASFYSVTPLPPTAIGAVLGVAAGSFLYVGAADLLPRLHEAHDRTCIVFFLAGLAAMAVFS